MDKMRVEDARLLLGTPSEDREERIDAYHTKVFEIKNFIFRTTLIPLLAKKRCHQLVQLHEALTALLEEENPSELVSPSLVGKTEQFLDEYECFSSHEITYPSLEEALQLLELEEEQQSLSDLIQQFEAKSSALKLLFSAAYDARWVSFFLSRMIVNTLAYQVVMNHYLYAFAMKLDVAYPELLNKEVKSGEGVLTSAWSQLLNRIGWDSIPLKQLEKLNHDSIPEEEVNKTELKTLFTEVIRCHKSLQIKL